MLKQHRIAVVIAAVVCLALVGHGRALAAGGSTLARDADPVVLTGADVPALEGIAPGALVAFRYDGGWTQIPVQVDERFVQNFSTIYNNVAPPTSSTNLPELVYADPNTFTGPDPDPTLDANDEIVFMSKDAGATAVPPSPPSHVTTGVEVTITDPLTSGAAGAVFLFRQDGSLDPAAGQSYVSYNFNLLSGDYKTTYHLGDGPNPENSTVTTPAYSEHLGDRWLFDSLRITQGSATGVDILDRQKALFAPGVCTRSEDTFDNGDTSGFPGEGAFIVNKSGPVRAIRSWLGANSGPNTERTDVFYAAREDIITDLRVHSIPSVMDFFDYSPAAAGMTYYNDLNPAGVTIDGVPDSPVAGPIKWEMVDGAQGSLVMAGTFSTNIPGFTYSSYYLDDSTPPVTQCTGDAFSYGSSGSWVQNTIPCTDPNFSAGCTSTLETTRAMYFLAPGTTTAQAQQLNNDARAPLAHTTTNVFVSSVGGVAVIAGPPPLAGSGASGALPAALALAVLMLLAGGGAAVAYWRRRSR